MQIRKRINRPDVPAGIAIVGLGLLWGVGFPAIDVVVAQLPPLSAAGIRYSASGGIVLLYAGMTTERWFPATMREVLGIVTVGGLMFGGYQAGLYIGTQYISAAIASVITTMSPVIAAIVAVPVLGESRGFLDIVGFCLGVAGVLALSQPSIKVTTLSLTAFGVWLVFLGTVLFAVGSIALQVFDENLPMESLQAWAMLVGAGLLFCGAIYRGESVPPLDTIPPAALGSLLYITIVSGVGGYLLYFRLVRNVGATETTLVAYLEPVAATAVAVLIFQESFNIMTIAGFVAIVAGFTLVSRDTIRETVAGVRMTATDSLRRH
jgi:drug/metabolite transporter (DMT)-like permease